jgi:hypothetical protein
MEFRPTPSFECPEFIPKTKRIGNTKHHFVMWFPGIEDWQIVVVYRYYHRRRGWRYCTDVTSRNEAEVIPP